MKIVIKHVKILLKFSTIQIILWHSNCKIIKKKKQQQQQNFIIIIIIIFKKLVIIIVTIFAFIIAIATCNFK